MSEVGVREEFKRKDMLLLWTVECERWCLVLLQPLLLSWESSQRTEPTWEGTRKWNAHIKSELEPWTDGESLDQTTLKASSNTRSFHLYKAINPLFVLRQFKLNFLSLVMRILTDELNNTDLRMLMRPQPEYVNYLLLTEILTMQFLQCHQDVLSKTRLELLFYLQAYSGLFYLWNKIQTP